ncbi:MAG: phasin family protein [Candidatus Thiodiazotropha sp. (ex Lucinoma kastoroae)]|nr:phasin family protein [Candidatus Thiodiazotropha sp. (ex Lucinoma borealis)]MCU7817110.1 phasin family protein [Candidatus Thiodiazotropha sp. (ex Rostrolucina anterorostrata)]MCU7840909.1 phasin family protein [Candidatus Thiodiazotropha sp. (ex Troendleina suluensis)]MCU7850527.1 phasin family protein [Candidatus Thiodiazotropha sp. (ex Lucinoma kastoroae)]MCU7885330.1 phasin family protein [Candidatus Thiodiazotropha sp. (ex Lucinoma annulata)]MCU7948001.1 phasin family protein [Candida
MNNPFDFTNLLKAYDPQAFLKQLQGGFSSYQLPNIDSDSFMESQKKNLEALMAANQAALSGTQELLRYQSEIMKQAMADATEAANSLASSTSPQEIAEKQTELVRAAFEKAVSNSTELSELMKTNQEQITALVNERFTDALKEVKDSIKKMG